ncbi:MAG: tetratricopeptide repeat-containing serine protease family protein [Pseudanabaenales cyanobacterium]|nr:tetratricopeptide repeat-containing serine protease family protein [Pseudanabaenales cyanobacterium]
MTSRLHLAVFGLVTLPLLGCNGLGRPRDIVGSLKESVVLITYGDQAGHGTGFVIKGNKAVCTVLTVAHAAPEEREIRLTTYDSQRFEAAQVQSAADVDLAVIVFKPNEDVDCPYPALAMGNSDRMKVGDFVRMAGYPERAGAERLVTQFPSGQITNIEIPPLPNGYAISYDMTTVGGMSGAPVVNAAGKVIAVHGLTDVELVRLGRNQQSNLSDDQSAAIEAAKERLPLARINHFKWGIPIKAFQRQRNALLPDNGLLSNPETLRQQANGLVDEADGLRNQKKYEESLALYEEALQLAPNKAKAWFGKGYSLDELGRYEEALAAYDKALEIDPDDSWAWRNRGNSLLNLDRYEKAISSYDKALEIDPDDSSAWTGRGASLEGLGRYEEAIASHDESLEIDPDYSLAWRNRGNSLNDLGRYEEAIDSYDKALEIDPDYFHAWNNRGISLNDLGRYEEAIASYDKALEIDPDYSLAWNNRGVSLKNLERYDEALESYEKAIEIDPSYQLAINNRNRLQEKLNQETNP